jgi:hypothetical protein
MAKAFKTDLAEVCVTVYGVTIAQARAEFIIWAAERVATKSGVEAAKKQLSIVNNWRHRMGMMPAYPEYGTLLF